MDWLTYRMREQSGMTVRMAAADIRRWFEEYSPKKTLPTGLIHFRYQSILPVCYRFSRSASTDPDWSGKRPDQGRLFWRQQISSDKSMEKCWIPMHFWIQWGMRLQKRPASATSSQEKLPYHFNQSENCWNNTSFFGRMKGRIRDDLKKPRSCYQISYTNLSGKSQISSFNDEASGGSWRDANGLR